ncbi:site-specific recombinase XerD [Pseudodesulfovibrio indicus]|nr:site-specific recombinase XerD [Pseudodesulfovibrio indicus]
MAILARCPFCRVMQSVKNKHCKGCGEDLDKLKRSRKIQYWVSTSIPTNEKTAEGKNKYRQIRKPVGYSIQEARDADGKHSSLKRENRLFDILPESNLTFNELRGWYIKLKSVKGLASYDRVCTATGNFCDVFGETIIADLKQVDLEEYQGKRLDLGRAPATVDYEISVTKTMVTKGFDNDKLDGQALKPFRRLKRALKKGSNARKRIVSFAEYKALLAHASPHLRPIIVVGMMTGMRAAEVRELRWSQIDREAGFIRLGSEDVKEKSPKSIPINRHVETVLAKVVRSISHDYVFMYKGEPLLSPSGFKKSLGAACKRAEIPYGRKVENGLTFHDFRRTVKTNMLRAGVSKELRDTILGHSLEGMDVHYLVPSDSDLTQAMTEYTDWLDLQLQIRDQSSNQA